MEYKQSKYKKWHKKASNIPIEESTMLIPQTIIVVIVFVFIAYVMFNYMDMQFKTESYEITLLSKTLRYSPDCLAYKDGSNVYPGVIDLAKVSEDNLKSCFKKEGMSFNVRIIQDEQEIKKAETMNARDLSNFKVCYTVPKVKCLTKVEPVLIAGNQNNALMKIEVIRYE